MITEKLFLHTVTDEDADEVAKTWPSNHSPLSEGEAKGVIANMQGNYAKNKKRSIYHLCLAVCRESDPGTIIGWCGLDGTRNREEPELFIILLKEYLVRKGTIEDGNGRVRTEKCSWRMCQG